MRGLVTGITAVMLIFSSLAFAGQAWPVDSRYHISRGTIWQPGWQLRYQAINCSVSCRPGFARFFIWQGGRRVAVDKVVRTDCSWRCY